MNNQSVSTQHVIILPNGAKHPVPYALFYCYSIVGLTRISQKHKHVAHVRRGLRAWPQKGNVLLSFEMKHKPAVDAGAVASSLAGLIRLSKCQEPNLYDELLVLYSALESQFGQIGVN